MPQSGVVTTSMRCPTFIHHSCHQLSNLILCLQYLLKALHSSPDLSIPDVLNQTFQAVDDSLSRMCEESDGKIHSGCTAVTAFLRIEDDNGKQTFVVPTESPSSEGSPVSSLNPDSDDPVESASAVDSGDDIKQDTKKAKKKSSTLSGSRIRKAIRNLASGSSSKAATPRSTSPADPQEITNTGLTLTIPPDAHRRVLYSANAGDARGVLCRGGKAVRLTYDHKGSDKQEAKRITDAGGFVMSGRVNGVLAVTRSLGDSSMKEFVVGAPYTTETELCDEDEFLIMACDGVRPRPS